MFYPCIEYAITLSLQKKINNMVKSTDTKAKKQITKPDSVKVNFKKVTKKEHAKYRIQVYSYLVP